MVLVLFDVFIVTIRKRISLSFIRHYERKVDDLIVSLELKHVVHLVDIVALIKVDASYLDDN